MTNSIPLVERSIVIPVFKNERSLVAVLDRVERINQELGSVEAVFVVDGSPDGSYDFLLHELPKRPFRFTLISHSRNFGAIAAVRTGLSHARGKHFLIMAADLQEPEGLIFNLFKALMNGGSDLVLAKRIGRRDPLVSKISASLFWRAYRTFVQSSMPEGGIDIFAGTNKLRAALLELPESNSSIVGQVLWLGFKPSTVEYERSPRLDGGKSSWSFRKKIRYMMDSVYGFSALPVQLITAIGAIGSLLCVVAAAVVACGRLLGAITVPGYTILMMTILSCTSIILFAIGVIGQPVWRAFENSKSRPLAVVDTLITEDDDNSDDVRGVAG